MASFQSKVVKFVFKLFTARRTSGKVDSIKLRNKIESLAKLAPRVRGTRWNKTTVAGVPSLEINADKFDTDKIILYLHGGAYNICSYHTHKRMVSRLSMESNIPAVVINYRLAPEHPFPAALEDTMAVYRHLLEKKYKHIIIAGDSAGGGLAIAALFKMREDKLPYPPCAVCFSPWMDLTFSLWHESHDDMLHIEALRKQASNYFDDHNPADPLISPLFGLFDNLPPVLIQVSTTEAIYNEIMLTAEKMEQQHTSVTLQIWEDVVHVWQAFWIQPEAKDAIRKAADFIRHHAA